MTDIQADTLRRIAEGDREAMAAFFEQRKTAVFRYALSILRDRYAAEDVTQEVFLRVFRSASQIREYGSTDAWVMAIARNTAFKHQKSESRYASVAPDTLRDVPDTEAHLGGQSGFLDLIAPLDAVTRDIVSLHIIGGLKHREIASVLGCAESAVRKRYSRALKLLRQYVLTEGGQ